MLILSLKSFIKTGVFGTIRVEVSKKAEVIDLMGNSFDFTDCGNSQIIRYGGYEFFYWTENETIYAIQNDQLFYIKHNSEEILYQNENVKIDPWFLKKKRQFNFEEVLEIIKLEGIKCEIIKDKFRGKYIKMQSGVTLDFIKNESTENIDISLQEEVLNGIRFFNDESFDIIITSTGYWL